MRTPNLALLRKPEPCPRGCLRGSVFLGARWSKTKELGKGNHAFLDYNIPYHYVF